MPPPARGKRSKIRPQRGQHRLALEGALGLGGVRGAELEQGGDQPCADARGGVDDRRIGAREAEVDLGGEVDGAAEAVVRGVEGVELRLERRAAGERRRERLDRRQLLLEHGLVVLAGLRLAQVGAAHGEEVAQAQGEVAERQHRVRIDDRPGGEEGLDPVPRG